MSGKSSPHSRFVTPLLVLLVFLLAHHISGGERQTDLLRSLKQADAALSRGGYAVTFHMRKPARWHDPNQGMVSLDGRAAQSEPRTLAMRIAYRYEKDPSFVSSGSRDYASADYLEGRLIVWRTMEKYVLSSPARNVAIERLKTFLVDPNNRAAPAGENTGVYYWPIGSDDSACEFRQFQHGIGRGYSKHLARVTSTEPADGLVKMTAEGPYGEGPEGIWELSIDPNSDWIVRSASFRFTGLDKPSVIVTNRGILSKDDVSIAKYGTYKSTAGLELSIEVDDLAREPLAVKRLVDEVTAVIDSPLPVGAFIMDMRKSPPVRTTVEQQASYW
jgi:hypothetical protein